MGLATGNLRPRPRAMNKQGFDKESDALWRYCIAQRIDSTENFAQDFLRSSWEMLRADARWPTGLLIRPEIGWFVVWS